MLFLEKKTPRSFGEIGGFKFGERESYVSSFYKGKNKYYTRTYITFMIFIVFLSSLREFH